MSSGNVKQLECTCSWRSGEMTCWATSCPIHLGDPRLLDDSVPDVRTTNPTVTTQVTVRVHYAEIVHIELLGEGAPKRVLQVVQLGHHNLIITETNERGTKTHSSPS